MDLTITADDKETVYGSSAPAFTFTDTEYAYNENASYLTGTIDYDCNYLASKESDNRHVGTYSITPKGLSSDDYEIEFVAGTLEVTKKTVRVTANDATITYGDDEINNGITYNEEDFVYDENSSLVNEENLVITATYDKEVEELRQVGAYTITASGLSALDYDFSYTNGTLNVVKKTLNISVNDKTIVYGTIVDVDSFEYNYNGFEYGETKDVLGGSLDINTDYNPSVYASRAVGEYSVIALGYESNNYEFNYIVGTLTVTKKDFTITIADAETTYGTPAPEFEYSTSEFAFDEDESYFGGTLVLTSGYVASKLSENRHSGEYSIYASSMYTSSNYNINCVDATLTVNKKIVRVTANDSTITYGDALVLNGFTYNEEDFVYDETFSLVNESNLSITSTYDIDDEDSRGAGTYPIIVAGLSALDYDFNYIDGTLHVLKKALNITADDKETVYGSPAPDFSVTSSGYVNGEDISALNGTLAYSCSYEAVKGSANRHAGTYDIIPSGLTSNNYEITFVKGELTVAKADLSVKVNNAIAIYGSPAPDFTHTDTGYVYEEDASYLEGSANYTCTYEAVKGSANRHVGTYDITLTGISSDDYNITYQKGTLNVIPKDLTIKAVDKDTVYGSAAPAFTASGIGFEYDETLDDLDDSLLAYTCSYEAVYNSTNRHAGTYAISISGYSAQDYNISYQEGTLTVAKKTLVIKAIDKETIYGYAAPAFTFTDSGYAYTEDINALSGEIAYSCIYEAVADSINRHAGTYDIIPSGFTSDDYEMDYQKGTLTVNKKALNIEALDMEVLYGTIVSPDMLEYSYDGFVLEEDETYLSGELVLVTTYDTSVYAKRSVGSYPINVSGYSSNDYDITYTAGELTVVAKPFEIVIDDKEITYGEAAPTYTYTLDEFAFEEDVSYFGGLNELSCSYEALYNSVNRHVGEYDIIATSKYTSTNYDISYVNGTLRVLPKELTIKADDKQTSYGNAAPAFTFTDTGYAYSENISVLSGEAIYSCIYEAAADSENRHGGTYDISIDESTFANEDYDIKYVKGTLTVAKIDLTISANDYEIVYGTDEEDANNGYTINDAMFVYNDSEADLMDEIEYSYTYDTSSADTRKVGTYTISISGFGSYDYNIIYVDATLTVSKKDLTIKADDKETIYGLASPSFSVSSSDFAFDEGFADLSGSASYTCTYNLADDDYNKATDYTIEVDGYSSTNYNISYQEGTLTVLRRPIKLHSDGDTKVYDGIPLSNENVSICEDTTYNLLDGHILSISSPLEITNAISRPNKMNLVVTSEDGLTDYTDNYDLDTYYDADYLEITRRKIKVTSATDEKDYDKTPLTNHNYTIELLDSMGEVVENGVGIVECDIETVTISGTITNVRYLDGQVVGRSNTIDGVTIRNKDTSDDVTSNYDITLEAGTLTINPRGIVIETGSSEAKIYDDEYVQVEEYSIALGSLPEGYHLDVTDFPRIKDAGTYPNIPTITVYDENDDVVDEDLFEITINPGKIIILPIVINLKSESADKPSDGNPLRASDYGKVFGAPENKDVLAIHKLDAQVVGETYGISYNTIDARILDLEDNPIRREDNNELAYTIIYTRDGHNESYSNNYLIYLNEGKLIIKDTYVRVDYNYTTPTGDFRSSKVYDGTPFTIDNVNYRLENIVDSHYVGFDQEVKLKIELHDGIEFESSVGSHILAKEDYDAYIVDVNDNILDYDVRYYDLPYRIYGDHELTIVGAYRSFSYDGMPHKAEDNEFECFGDLKVGHNIEVHYTETRTDLGTTYADFEYNIYDAGHNNVTDQYTIDTVQASVIINTRYLNFAFEPITHIYDGTYVSADMENVTSISGLLSGHRVESILMDNSYIKDCYYIDGEIASQLLRIYSFVVLDEDDNDVTRYYHTITSINGIRITVLPRDINFTSDSVYKYYDGEALVGNKDQVHYVDGLVDGDYYVITSMTGSQTDIGHTKNSFEFRVYDEYDRDISGNYKLGEETEIGVLSVKGIINITTGNIEKLYDGTKVDNEYTCTATLMDGYDPDVVLYSNVNRVSNVRRVNGEVVSYIDYVTKLTISNGLDETSSYVIKYQYDTKEDGTIYVRSTEEYSLKNKNNHLFKEYNEDGELINRLSKRYNYVGDEEIYVGILAKPMDDFDYEVNLDAGSITINPRTIVVYSTDAEYDYDGYEHYNAALIPIIDLENEHYDLLPNHNAVISNPLKVRFATLNEDEEVVTVTNSANLSDVRVMNGMVDVTSNYEVLDYRPGTLKVNKRDLTIITHDTTKEFDGIAYFESDEEELYDAYGLAETDVLINKLFGNIETSLGEYEFEMKFDISNQEVDCSAFNSYNITYELGTLTIDGDEFDLGDGMVVNNKVKPEGGADIELKPTPCFDFTPSFTGVVYFRGRSYGDYISGLGFNSRVTPYKDKTYNPLEYQAIYNDASDTIDIDITNGEYKSFITTYYTDNDLSLFTDVYTSKSYKEPYTLNVYRGELTALAGAILESEQTYRLFVYDNYLNLWIGGDFLASIDEIISAQGFDKNDPDIIEKVKNYIYNSGKYNFFYSTEDNYDPVHYFLTESHEGDATIFTAAAMLIYRRLGIPARYVTGFVKAGTADVVSTVTGFDGHSWLEVYKDGYGWVLVDPTPLGDGEGGSGGSGGIGGSGGSIGDIGDIGEHMGEGIGTGGDGFYPQGGDLSTSMNYPNPSGDKLVIFVINASVDGTIYLKEESRGDYNGQGFDKVLVPYTSSYYNPMEYPALAQGGEAIETIVIDMTQGCGVPEQYRVIPYYVSGDLTDFNDIFVYGDNTEPYSYDYIVNNIDYADPPQVSKAYEKYENQYRSYVYANYLSQAGMSDELKDLFDRIISDNGFNKDNANIINDVARYIQNAADYDKSFEIPNDCEDFVYYFLAVSKTGVCQHYAAAATMLYRYLGIPARWTTGFMANAQACQNTPVLGEQYHAWVEVYIDGFGWAPVEVTGSPRTNPFEIKVGYNIQSQAYTGSEFDFDREQYRYVYTINKEISSLPEGYRVVLELPYDYHFESEPGTYMVYGSDYEAYVLNEKGQVDELYTSYIIKCDSEYNILEETDLIIYPEDERVIYDGKLHTLEGYYIVGELRDGHTLNVMFRTKAKEVGTYNVTYIYTIRDESNQDVSEQYHVTKKEGTLIIDKAPLKIYFNDIHHEYDGKTVTIDINAVNHVDGLLEGHSLVQVSSNDRFIEKMYDDLGEITYGVAYVSSFKIEDAEGNDVSKYYSCAFDEMLQYNRCNVYIDSPTITLKPEDVYEYYDGKEHSPKNAIVDKGKLPMGYTIEAEFIGSLSTVGEATSSIIEGSVHIYNQNHDDVTEDYNILLTTGIISLEKRKISVTASVSATYDGKLHAATFELLDGDLDDYNIAYEITGARIDAGRSEAVFTSFTITSKKTGEDCTEHFDIEYVDGVVEVTPYEVTIKPRDKSKPYDGDPLTSDEVEYVTEMLEGYTISIVTDGVATSSGDYDNNIIDYVVYNSMHQVVTDNFDVTCEKGLLSISCFNITLTPRDQSFTYDGTMKSARSLIAKVVDTDMEITVTAEVVGSLTNVGYTDIEIVENSVVIKDSSGHDITEQFKITLKTGKLTIKQRGITIKPEDVVGVYNGEEYSPNNYQITSKNKLAEGHSAIVRYKGSLSEVGSIQSSIVSVQIVDEHYQDVTSNYKITCDKGTITVVE